MDHYIKQTTTVLTSTRGHKAEIYTCTHSPILYRYIVNMLQIEFNDLLSSTSFNLQQSLSHAPVQRLGHCAASYHPRAGPCAYAGSLLGENLLKRTERQRLGGRVQESQNHVRG